tara:strand:- start:497 stop:820 length:324 start_codon:yes stop_codon:yes gene_type:complete
MMPHFSRIKLNDYLVTRKLFNSMPDLDIKNHFKGVSVMLVESNHLVVDSIDVAEQICFSLDLMKLMKNHLSRTISHPPTQISQLKEAVHNGQYVINSDNIIHKLLPC